MIYVIGEGEDNIIFHGVWTVVEGDHSPRPTYDSYAEAVQSFIERRQQLWASYGPIEHQRTTEQLAEYDAFDKGRPDLNEFLKADGFTILKYQEIV